MSRSLGIPVKLMHEATGHIVTVELKSGELYRGSMIECEDNWNCQLENITFTAKAIRTIGQLPTNGAEKTTAINCLTCTTPVTGGDALIYGNSIRSSVGMLNIRRIIGVCPQFDILWDALTGQEHLRLFASIKGLPRAPLATVVQKSLAEVRLTNAAKMRSSSYSGGMKRRLSVAISLLGDPKLIILDEPTTCMDLISRRHVWDIIEKSKQGRAIILTTHSMEEADILSDRIGIMTKGRLR